MTAARVTAARVTAVRVTAVRVTAGAAPAIGRRRRLLVALAAVAAVAAAACGGAGGSADTAASGGGERFRPLAVGAPAPTYAVRTLDGDTVRVGAGTVPTDGAAGATLLNVWATWCGPCKREFPELERLHREHARRGLRIVAVSIDVGDDAPVAAFARDHGATFTIGRDVSGTIQDRYRSIGVPESYLIAADGTLLWRHVGELPANDPSLRSALERAGL